MSSTVLDATQHRLASIAQKLTRLVRWGGGAVAVTLAIAGCGGGGGGAADVTSTATVSAPQVQFAAYALAQQALAAPVALATTPPASSNMVANGGFESGMAGWANWANASVVSGQASSGTSALGVGTAAGGAGQEVAGIVPGSMYRLTAQAKVSAPSETLYVGVNFLDQSGAPFTQNAVLITSTAYTTAGFDVVAPPDAVKALVYVWKNAGSGLAYVDDFTFDVAGSAAPGSASSANLVANGGFENGLASWVDWGNTSTSTAQPAAGSSAAQVGTGAGGFGQQVAGVAAGNSYRVSAQGKVSTPGEIGYLGVMFTDDAGNGLQVQNVVFRSTTYSTIQADVTAPANATRALVFVWKNAGGGFTYVDEVALTARPIDATLLAKGEFRVNATTMGHQSFPTIATLANGGYVVVWMSSNQDGAGTSIYSQRYDRTGAPLGGETPVSHSLATEAHQYPQVAGLNDGGYVVVWTSASAGYQVIYAQRFDAAGAVIGAATRVSPDTLPVAITPSVAALADGGFLVTWSSYFASIDAQRYDRNGNSLGGSTRVNVTEGGAWQTAVTGLRDGGYALAWGLLPIDVPPPDVYTRRFDAAGARVGGETRANTFTAGAQQEPDIAALRDGGSVVTWMSQNQDGSGYGIYAQRIDSSGAPVGSETQINTVTSGSQESPGIAGLGDGGYVVVWFNGDIHAQRFDSNGAPVGAEARVNTAALSAAQPAITALPSGGYVVAWQSGTQDGSGYGIYAQQFDAQGVAR